MLEKAHKSTITGYFRMLETFLTKLKDRPLDLDFKETLNLIDSLYTFADTSFQNGSALNEAGQNSGSCKVFAFAKLHHLDEPQTLLCFGQYYRKVVATPNAVNHQNIRQFMQTRWKTLLMSTNPLTLK